MQALGWTNVTGDGSFHINVSDISFWKINQNFNLSWEKWLTHHSSEHASFSLFQSKNPSTALFINK